jgi:hypothetical protein
MKKLFVLAPFAAATLVGASPPDSVRPTDATAYPPCSRTVTDRCIQLGDAKAKPVRVAQGGPYEAAGAPESTAVLSDRDYPPCSASVTDRCQQGASAPARHHRVRHARISRAGERG